MFTIVARLSFVIAIAATAAGALAAPAQAKECGYYKDEKDTQMFQNCRSTWEWIAVTKYGTAVLAKNHRPTHVEHYCLRPGETRGFYVNGVTSGVQWIEYAPGYRGPYAECNK